MPGTGTRFRVAAVDGRDLNQPDEVSHVGLLLPAGGRYDLIFDIAGNATVEAGHSITSNGALHEELLARLRT